MRNVRVKVLSVFVLVGMFFSFSPVFTQPIYASANYTLPPIEQPSEPSVCTESVEDSVNWLNQYNLTVLEDLQQVGDVEGTTFVGGNLTYGNSANFGIKLPNTNSCSLTTLTVAGNFSSGGWLNIQGGGVEYGGSLNGRQFNFNGSQGCSASQNSSLTATYAAQVASDMSAFSTYLKSFAANNVDPVVNPSNNLEFIVDTKTTDGLAVFDVTAAQVFQSGAGGLLNIVNNAGASTILINVTGASVTWQNGSMGDYFRNNAAKIIWNFSEATTINLSPELYGAVIAPLATLSTNNNLNGSVVVKTLAHIGEVHLPLFSVTNIPPLSGNCPEVAGISIKKYTNDEDADAATGPIVAVGSTVTWTYIVTNTGDVPLSNVVVIDDQGVVPVYQNGDADTDNKLDVDETWTYLVTGTAVAGQYENLGTVTGKSPEKKIVTDNDPSHYFGAVPGIAIKKYTNGEDADNATGPVVSVGSTITWTYIVTNSGNVPLNNVVVTDDQGVVPVYQKGDSNSDGFLDLNETWTYQVTGTAVVGQYENLGTVTGTSPDQQAVSDTDPSHYFGAAPGIAIKKYTNGDDADTATGPIVPVGSTITWTYVVTNSGNVPLSNIIVTDNKGVVPVYQAGDTNTDDLLDVDETWTFLVTGTAVAGQYENLGTVTGKSSNQQEVTDNDPSHYFGAVPGIAIKKYTNGEDADNATGPIVAVGSNVTWTYVVTNSGNVPLSNVTVSDDQGVVPVYQNGDTNGNSKLDVDETWTYQVAGKAVAGQYENLGTVTGVSPDQQQVSDNDPSHYFGSNPGIAIKKYTNGEDADTPTGPVVPVGSTVTWSYVVTNSGNVPLSNVSVTDDMGVVPVYQNGDGNNNGLLDVDETWTYQVTGTATPGQYKNLGTVTGVSPDQQQVSDNDPSHYFGAVAGIVIKKYTNGEDADTVTGPVAAVGGPVTWTYVVTNSGNVPLSDVVVTDNKGVVPVYQGGDSNNNSKLDVDETWTYQVSGIAVAGQYENLGTVTAKSPDQQEVTDNDPSHYFGVVAGIVIKKYTNGEDADTVTGPVVAVGSTVTWTYVVTNSGNVPLSNVVVTDDQGVVPVYQGGDSDNDSLLDVGETWTYQATGTAIAGQYENLGTVTGKSPNQQEVSDSDPSHYFGSTPTPEVASLGDRVWLDTNANGLQDNGESGMPNVTVNLLAGDCVTPMNQSTTTNANGIYGFDNLAPGSYCVHFEAPTGYKISPQNVGDNDAVDSDGDPVTGKTASVTLVGGTANLTLDLGLYAPASLGDRVWVDSNENGVQDNGEANVQGVKVTLYNCNDQQVGQPTTTDANGNYQFTDLTPGCYYVIFDPTTLPEDYVFTTQHVGGAGSAVDSDANVSTGKTPSVTLESGDNYLDLDAGVVPPQPPTPEIVLSRLGDTVWYDLNGNGLQDNLNQPGGEQGVAEVEVRLYQADGTFVKSMKTDANGTYLFTDLQPGSYYVEFGSVPGYSFTHYNVSGATPDADDSDAIVPWVDVTISESGEEAELGEPLTYTFFYTNTDATQSATNVVISTTIPAGTSFEAAASNPGWNCATTNAGGVCTVTVATLAPNTSGSAAFTVRVGDDDADVPEAFIINAHLTQATVARTEVVTLGEDDENLTIDAGIVRIESGLTIAGPTAPTNLPIGEQPNQRMFIFLPTVQSEQ